MNMIATAAVGLAESARMAPAAFLAGTTPEPSAFAIVGLGLIGVSLLRRKAVR